jgi:hypothetical protein
LLLSTTLRRGSPPRDAAHQADVEGPAVLEPPRVEGELLLRPVQIADGEGAEVVLGELAAHAFEPHHRQRAGLGPRLLGEIVVEGGLAAAVAVLGGEALEELHA